ncbi:MAG: hypothetical protein H0X51_06465 [Parachlamydiaceae bacterium]|nr:hypothetical protein [Parachlamydiaceae bacterium]
MTSLTNSVTSSDVIARFQSVHKSKPGDAVIRLFGFLSSLPVKADSLQIHEKFGQFTFSSKDFQGVIGVVNELVLRDFLVHYESSSTNINCRIAQKEPVVTDYEVTRQFISIVSRFVREESRIKDISKLWKTFIIASQGVNPLEYICGYVKVGRCRINGIHVIGNNSSYRFCIERMSAKLDRLERSIIDVTIAQFNCFISSFLKLSSVNETLFFNSVRTKGDFQQPKFFAGPPLIPKVGAGAIQGAGMIQPLQFSLSGPVFVSQQFQVFNSSSTSIYVAQSDAKTAATDTPDASPAKLEPETASEPDAAPAPKVVIVSSKPVVKEAHEVKQEASKPKKELPSRISDQFIQRLNVINVSNDAEAILGLPQSAEVVSIIRDGNSQSYTMCFIEEETGKQKTVSIEYDSLSQLITERRARWAGQASSFEHQAHQQYTALMLEWRKLEHLLSTKNQLTED